MASAYREVMDWTMWAGLGGFLLLVGLWAYFKNHLERRSRRLEHSDPEVAAALRGAHADVEKGRRAVQLNWPT
ncbi:hypothetical protein WDJ51_02670 [Rathayibacter sp. YIM 133350]|uniref:hypothetical protein n=1 Tax=Rathayibacter sp. YIM 133350 TaxID=3131992 RepID=UPI00307DB673